METNKSVLKFTFTVSLIIPLTIDANTPFVAHNKVRPEFSMGACQFISNLLGNIKFCANFEPLRYALISQALIPVYTRDSLPVNITSINKTLFNSEIRSVTSCKETPTVRACFTCNADMTCPLVTRNTCISGCGELGGKKKGTIHRMIKIYGCGLTEGVRTLFMRYQSSKSCSSEKLLLDSENGEILLSIFGLYIESKDLSRFNFSIEFTA